MLASRVKNRALLALLFAACCGVSAAQPAAAEIADAKHTLGATALLRENSTGLELPARIDTGAKSCSLHVDEVDVENARDDMRKNVGKPARLLIRDEQAGDVWIDAEIADTVLIKNPNSAKKQRRYKVWLTLCAGDVNKRVLVTLSDRSHLTYPLLIGRNFLRDDFVVDVALDNDD